MNAKREGAGWSFDEAAHAGNEHLDPDYVAAYDRTAQTDPTEDLAILRGLGLDRDSVLVDLGAGTGTFALAAAPICRRVVAVDVSAVMLSMLGMKIKRLALSNVECVQAGFLTYERPPASVDFVYSRNALHHLPDFWKAIALARIAAMLRTRGILRLRDLVFSFEPGQGEGPIEAWLASAASDQSEGWTREELETHLRQEYSTNSWLLEPILRNTGFEIREATHGASQMYSAYTCIKR
jgi:ubiquinone/menaquinone biosynthesis C-methylase UbiE